MPILDPELRSELANRIRYYNELGIYDFYRREGSAAEPLVAEAELAVAVESTVADFGAAVRSAPSPDMTAKRIPKIIPAVAEPAAPAVARKSLIAHPTISAVFPRDSRTRSRASAFERRSVAPFAGPVKWPGPAQPSGR